MPTLEHNAFVEMFRDNPNLAPHIMELLFHVELPSYATVAVVESSLDQMIPVEFRADLVLELRDAGSVRVLAIVVEVQRDEDPDKKYAWPVYVAAVRAKKRCQAIVLVVTPDVDVAQWAAEKIDLGLGRGSIEPLVLGPASVPEVTDRAEAERETELAILSAVVHGNGPNGLAVVVAALGALGRLDQEHATGYFQIVYNALREPVRRALEASIMERQTESDAAAFMQRLINRGEIRGEIKGRRDALLRFIARAGIALTEDDRARIQACSDAAILDRWIDNAVGAKAVADVLS